MGKDKFKSRTLVNGLTVVTILDYLNDNLDGEEPLQVTLTMDPRRVDKTDYCSRKKREVKKIEVKSAKEISEISSFLFENLFMDWIHVDIE